MPDQTLNLKALQQQLQEHLQRTQPQFQPHDLQLLAHGEANVIYRLNRDRLVRVAVNTPNQRFQGKISRVTRFEQAILQYLQGSSISHTLYDRFLHPTSDFPYTYLITNFLEGGSLNYSHKHLQQCAQTLAHLHRLPLVAGYELDRLFGIIPQIEQPLHLFYSEAKAYAQPYLDSPDADPEIVEMLQQVLTKAEARLKTESLLAQYPHLCLVHSDHTYENWVINPQQAYLIDWEWAELGSPAGDLGHFLSPVTVHRYQNYWLPPADRQFFLQSYYEALEDADLAATMRIHFAVFGAFPALRSLCWTAGYWVTAVRWYADALEDSPSARDRLRRFEESRRQFPQLWQEVMTWLDEEI
ncbi:MAG: aminoglycoside phosphotransferase family protein [Elainellaceae cyanobacterium]